MDLFPFKNIISYLHSITIQKKSAFQIIASKVSLPVCLNRQVPMLVQIKVEEDEEKYYPTFASSTSRSADVFS